jgi:hypothetical protein
LGGRVLGQVSNGTSGTAPEPIVLDGRRQLFLDDYLIASMKGARRVVETAQKHPANPVLWPKEAWEDKMATIYGSVTREANGRWRMWYKGGMGVAYAESGDGIKWVKPELDHTIIDGKKTNILWKKKAKREPPAEFPFFYELFGVHRDERDPDPGRRYKMGFLDIDWAHKGPGGDPFHPGQRRGLGIAVSPDGIRWTRVENWASEAICDGATHWMWDPARRKYVLYGRTRKWLPEVREAWSKYDWFKDWFSGRAVARIESGDFMKWDFTQPASAPVVMTADLQDRPGTEIYSMKVFPYEGIYIGLVQVFHATPDEGTLDVQLAVSRDGVKFERVGDRSAFIPLGGVGSWDRFNHSLANNDPIAVGDELRIYYGGRCYRHDPYKGPDKGPNHAGIGLASVLRDRFVALEASWEGGEVVTRPLTLNKPVIRVNAAARFGEIKVDVLDPAGKVLADSKLAVREDSLDAPVEFEGDVAAVTGKPVALKFRLKNARLYSLWA